MKEIVVISGKGGTGKTSITASFAWLGGKDIIVADCDVDAADMHLLLQPNFVHSEDFSSGKLAKIDQQLCGGCGVCTTICRFEAIVFNDNQYSIDSINCEGCGYCARVCPENAITMDEQNVGQWFISDIKTGSRMVHARLGIGAENSGKLVAKVKNEAKLLARHHDKNFILVDGSPGIGCPVISSLSGAHYAVLVTEPTVSGLHDLIRIHRLVQSFSIPVGCIINKADLNREIARDIMEYLEKEDIDFIASLPYDESFTKAMVNGRTIVEENHTQLADLIKASWEKIKKLLEKEEIKK